jgi:hypothetical protein
MKSKLILLIILFFGIVSISNAQIMNEDYIGKPMYEATHDHPDGYELTKGDGGHPVLIYTFHLTTDPLGSCDYDQYLSLTYDSDNICVMMKWMYRIGCYDLFKKAYDENLNPMGSNCWVSADKKYYFTVEKQDTYVFVTILSGSYYEKTKQ